MRKAIPLIALLLLAVPVSAYQVRSPGPVYEVKYSVLSNGTDALIHLDVLQWGITCGMVDCWPEVYSDYDYLLYFNGSQLYLLNFTPALGLPTWRVFYRGATFFNGSWYLWTEYYPPACSTLVDRIYRLDLRDLCIKPADVEWFELPRGNVSDSIDGWRIELQSLGPGEWGYANVSDLWIALSENVTNWSPGGPITFPKSSVFPVYFTLKKGNLTKKITLLYINTTNNSEGLVQGFWFPGDVKIVNVTVCRSASVRFPITALRVDGVYRGGEGVLLVVGYEVLSPGVCPGNPLNCTLVPDMVSSYLFYVSSSGPYFLGAYPEEPAVTFENGLWRFKLHLWNGSVENATFNPACLNDSNVSPVELPNVSVDWYSVRVGNLTVSYPAEFLGFSNNHTVIILNEKISKVLPHVPFAVGVNGRFYPLFRSVNGTLLPVPPKVGPDLNCTPSTPSETSTARGENREICGPGVILLLATLSAMLFRKTGGDEV
ncbi:hypothetical protein [Thermococcus sp.]|uniref:hypothetical protein n=1 Tax=Thermococcus sp. TaxID=35749 RepID=UPI002616ED16|nr:hypothetical protein [Thermococcus sp.]